jgi:hypothetical protein
MVDERIHLLQENGKQGKAILAISKSKGNILHFWMLMIYGFLKN